LAFEILKFTEKKAEILNTNHSLVITEVAAVIATSVTK